DDLRRYLDDEGLFGDADVRVLDLHGVYRSNERILKGCGPRGGGLENTPYYPRSPLACYSRARGSATDEVVREGRVELPRPHGRRLLRPVRLPIPPLSRWICWICMP